MPKKCTRNFLLGQFVFAKIPKNSFWPGRILHIQTPEKNCKELLYLVYFYSLAKQVYLSAKDIVPYDCAKNQHKYGQLHIRKQEPFNTALLSIKKDFLSQQSEISTERNENLFDSSTNQSEAKNTYTDFYDYKPQIKVQNNNLNTLHCKSDETYLSSLKCFKKNDIKKNACDSEDLNKSFDDRIDIDKYQEDLNSLILDYSN